MCEESGNGRNASNCNINKFSAAIICEHTDFDNSTNKHCKIRSQNVYGQSKIRFTNRSKSKAYSTNSINIQRRPLHQCGLTKRHQNVKKKKQLTTRSSNFIESFQCCTRYHLSRFFQTAMSNILPTSYNKLSIKAKKKHLNQCQDAVNGNCITDTDDNMCLCRRNRSITVTKEINLKHCFNIFIRIMWNILKCHKFITTLIIICATFSCTTSDLNYTWTNTVATIAAAATTNSQELFNITTNNQSSNSTATIIITDKEIYKYPALKAFQYEENFIERINPFWLKFEPPTDKVYTLLSIGYLLLFLVGGSANGLVIYMFVRCKSLRIASNILVCNLAVSDLLIVLKCPIAAYNNYVHGQAFGDWGCRLYGFIGGLSGTASILTLTAIAIDRYMVVVKPLSPLRFDKNLKYYYFMLATVWLTAIFFSGIPLLEIGLSYYTPEGYLTTCSFDYLDMDLNARIFMFSFFFFAYVIPFSIICWCYFGIFVVVYQTRNINSNKNNVLIEIRLSMVIFAVILLWFLAWTPYAWVAMKCVFGQVKDLTPDESMVPAIFCKVGSCFNPILYTISHSKFRKEMYNLFCPKRRLALRRSTLVSSTTRSSYFSSRRIRRRTLYSEYDMKLSGPNERNGSRNGNSSYLVDKNILAEAFKNNAEAMHCNSSKDSKGEIILRPSRIIDSRQMYSLRESEEGNDGVETFCIETHI